MRKAVFAAIWVVGILVFGAFLYFLRFGAPWRDFRDEVAETIPPIDLPVRDGMVQIPAREFVMGAAGAENSEETPAHRVRLDVFWIDLHEVTNAQFATFAEEENYTTTAERRGWSYVFDEGEKAWVKTERAPIGAIPTAANRRSSARSRTRWCTSLTLTPSSTAAGPESGFRPKRNGSVPPGLD